MFFLGVILAEDTRYDIMFKMADITCDLIHLYNRTLHFLPSWHILTLNLYST